MSERIPMDDRCLDVSDESGNGWTALVRDGRLRACVYTNGAGVSVVPESYITWNCFAKYEVSYGRSNVKARVARIYESATSQSIPG